jgi:phenylacetate-coenzyme A ligase PaaK-like adenylate-forming protein
MQFSTTNLKYRELKSSFSVSMGEKNISYLREALASWKDMSLDEFQAMRDRRFSKSLRFQYDNNTPYRRLLQEHGFTQDTLPKSYQDICKLPVIDKDWISREDIAHNPSAPVDDCVHTTGSTGSPVEFPLSWHTKMKSGSEPAMLFMLMTGANFDTPGYIAMPSEPPGLGYKCCSMIADLVGPGFTNASTTNMPPDMHLRKMTEQGTVFSMSGPPFYAALANVAMKMGVPTQLKHLMAGGAAIYPEDFSLVKQMLGPGGKYFEYYANTETGFPAFQTEERGPLRTFTPRFNIEILGQDGLPVEPNQEGRVIITAPFVDAYPALRYDIGDNALLISDKPDDNKMFPAFSRVRRYKEASIGGGLLPLYMIEDMAHYMKTSGIKVFALQVALRREKENPYIDTAVVRFETPPGVPDEAAGRVAVEAFRNTNEYMASEMATGHIRVRAERYDRGTLTRRRAADGREYTAFKLQLFVDERGNSS